MDNDDILLYNLKELLKSKYIEIENILSSSKKLKIDDNINNIDYNTNKTISKINAETKRKLESSKSYKKKTQIIS